MLKELDVKQALLLLAEKYPEPVEGWFWYDEQDEKDKGILSIDTENEKHPFLRIGMGNYLHFAVEVPDEYRHMTQQECIDWVCLHGYKGHQVRYKNGAKWFSSGQFSIEPKEMEYRTIQEIDGKIVYGQPQEFKVRVE